MNKYCATLLFLVGMILVLPVRSDAETRTISWNAVTTYTDGTPIDATKTVSYDIFWTTDAGLSSASLRTVASSVLQTSSFFDPDVLGMPGGQTVFFTIITGLSTGERSALSLPYSWIVPIVVVTPNAVPSPPSGGIIIRR